ncbi:hypothetical protein GGI05_005173, partial [Coemansia sp. RSA 2603]
MALQLEQRHYLATEGGAQRDAGRRSSGSTASASSSLATGSWLGGKKRDWDNAFMSKYQDLEATLQENDQWLTMYLESVAISEALKTSSTKRRGRPRMDVRDVFGNATVKLSPLASQLNSASMWSLRKAKRRSSQYGTLQGNTLNMAIAQMAMMPPKSPYLTNVGKQADGALGRSNSAAAKTAAAVKRLQAIEGSPPSKPAVDPVSASSDVTMTSPGPVSAHSVMSVGSPQRTAPVSRPAMAAPVPTLRDMLLNHSPMRPPVNERSQSAGQRPGLSTIPLNLGMAFDSRANEQMQAQKMQRRAEHSGSPVSSAESSPERLVSAADLNRSRSVTASEGEGELTKSEDEVRDRFQKVQIAMSRANSVEETVAGESPVSNDEQQQQQKLQQQRADDEALLAIEVDEDIAALYRDIDEVSKMLPTSQGSSQHSDGGSQHSTEGGSETRSRFVDVDIDQQPMDVRLDDVSVDVEDEVGS